MLHLISRIVQNRFAKTSLVLILIQGLTLLVSFIGNVFLAGIYKTPAGFGAFNYYFSLITTLGNSAAFGMDTFLIKRNLELSLENRTAEMAALIGKSLKMTLVVSLICALVSLGANTHFFTRIHTNDYYLVVGILGTGLLVVRSYSLRSLGELLYSNLLNQALKTLLFYFFIFLIYVLHFQEDANIGVVSFVVATLACWIWVEYLLRRRQQSICMPASSSTYTYASLLGLGFPFFMYDLVGNFSLNVDVFLIEYMGNDFFLGQYSFYKKLSLIPFMAITVVGAVLQTQYLEVYRNSALESLQRFVIKTNRWMFVFSMVACLALFGSFWAMSNYVPFFRSHFSQYFVCEWFLYVLCAGEIFCAAFGPNNYFMLMLGYEKAAVAINILFCVLWFVLGTVFNHYMGAEGFVWAYVASRVFKSVAVWYYIKRHLRVSFFIF